MTSYFEVGAKLFPVITGEKSAENIKPLLSPEIKLLHKSRYYRAGSIGVGDIAQISEVDQVIQYLSKPLFSEGELENPSISTSLKKNTIELKPNKRIINKDKTPFIMTEYSFLLTFDKNGMIIEIKISQYDEQLP